MAGIVTYEIVPPSERAIELSKFVSAAVGGSQESLAPKSYTALVSGVIDSLGALARASSDDGKAPDFASIPFLG